MTAKWHARLQDKRIEDIVIIVGSVVMIMIGDGVAGDDGQLYVLPHRILRRASGI